MLYMCKKRLSESSVVCCSGEMSSVGVSSGQYNGHRLRHGCERVMSSWSETDQWTQFDDGIMLCSRKMDS